MVIYEKSPQDEVFDISPSKRGKIADDSKGKDAMLLPEPKKKVVKSNKAISKRTHLVAPGEGTSAYSGDI